MRDGGVFIIFVRNDAGLTLLSIRNKLHVDSYSKVLLLGRVSRLLGC